MTERNLEAVAKALVAEGKGILAADEDAGMMVTRFNSLGIPPTDENRHKYWEMLFATPGMNKYINGIILCEEALCHRTADGTPLVDILASQNMIPGVNVDKDTTPLEGTSGEVITAGLDDLHERLDKYLMHGAKFTKWRAVIAIGDSIPTNYCIDANALALARFASLSQKAGMVPFVEPDVLIAGAHSIERCQAVTEVTLERVFQALSNQDVKLEQIVLKASMVLPGKDHIPQSEVAEVAEATVAALRKLVPAAVPGVAFLSGGQSNELATAHLNAMNAMAESHQWRLSFCFGRALQERPVKIWAGQASNIADAQAAFSLRARLNGAACRGTYDSSMELDVPDGQPQDSLRRRAGA